MSELAKLKPTRNRRIFDLVEEAGLDVSDWISSSNDPRGHKGNPKYCFEWSFVEPGKFVILNLWHDRMAEEGGSITHSENYRANAEFHQQNGGKAEWVRRGRRLDNALEAAARHGWTIRVILLTGIRRNTHDPASASSTVKARALDPEPWHLSHYDRATGDFTLVRGAAPTLYADQFDIADRGGGPERRQSKTNAFVRDPKVRRDAMLRASGQCEFCQAAGFRMAGGQIYLETHHIHPLGEGGADHIRNVIALCPNDHRRAHHGADQLALRDAMLEIVRSK